MLYRDQGKCSTSNFSVDDLQLPHNRGAGDFKLSLKYADEYLSILRQTTYPLRLDLFCACSLIKIVRSLHVDNSKVYLNGSKTEWSRSRLLFSHMTLLGGYRMALLGVYRMALLGVYSGMFVYAEVWKHSG